MQITGFNFYERSKSVIAGAFIHFFVLIRGLCLKIKGSTTHIRDAYDSLMVL